MGRIGLVIEVVEDEIFNPTYYIFQVPITKLFLKWCWIEYCVIIGPLIPQNHHSHHQLAPSVS